MPQPTFLHSAQSSYEWHQSRTQLSAQIGKPAITQESSFLLAGAFLIPYLLLLFVVGRPLYYLEFVLGQFSGKGPINVWKCVPALKGIYGRPGRVMGCDRGPSACLR